MHEIMSNESKSTWTKFVERPRRFFLTLALTTIVLLALCFGTGILLRHVNPSPGLRSVAAFLLVALTFGFVIGFFGFFLALIPSLQPLFRWVVRRSVFLAACLITLVAVFYAEENWRGKHAWENFKREAQSRGESMEIKDIIPPAVPDDQNVAATPLFKPIGDECDLEWRRMHSGPNGVTNVADRLNFGIGRTNEQWPDGATANWMIGQRTDLKAWQNYYRNPTPPAVLWAEAQAAFAERYGLPGTTISKPVPTTATNAVPNEFPTTPQPQTPVADVLLALSKYDAILDELRSAAARPQARFPIRYEDGFSALLPHLARMKSLNQFLALRAAAKLESGRTNDAAADVELSLRLADLVREEPFLISHLVRLAQFQVALNPLWEGFVEHRWTDGQLANFERRLSQFDFLADFQRALRGERACCTWTIDYVNRMRDASVLGNPEDQSGGPSASERMFGEIMFQLIPSGWFEQNKASLGRLHMELILPTVDRESRLVSPSNMNRLMATLEQRLTRRSPYNWFGALLLPAIGNASSKFAQGQASADLARVACALERHRLAQGQYPETLDALAPQFIAKIPHDVITGQPLKYRRTADGFTLYSVGWNEKDDGGSVVTTKDKRRPGWTQGDLVWQMPAK